MFSKKNTIIIQLFLNFQVDGLVVDGLVVELVVVDELVVIVVVDGLVVVVEKVEVVRADQCSASM